MNYDYDGTKSVAKLVDEIIESTVDKYKIKCVKGHNVNNVLRCLASEVLEELGYHVFDVVRAEIRAKVRKEKKI